MSPSPVSVGSQGPARKGIDCCPRELGVTTALVALDPVAGVLLPCVPETFMSWVPLSSSTSIQSPRRVTPGLAAPRGQQTPAAVSEGASFSREAWLHFCVHPVSPTQAEDPSTRSGHGVRAGEVRGDRAIEGSKQHAVYYCICMALLLFCEMGSQKESIHLGEPQILSRQRAV